MDVEVPSSPMNLFPPNGLDTSILVAVLIGVWILALLTEWLGWVFSGLVVPGYLASVLLIRPEAGAAVIVETLLTWGLARLLANVLSRTGAWSSFFGRERFFLIVLSSIGVRATCEIWLFPATAVALDEQLPTRFVLDHGFFSIGLVLVPLGANAMWKLSLGRGVLQLGVPVLLTYALLRWVLLPYTNLSFSRFELTYEDVALTFLASPKAYILLLTGAYFAARYNLRYGWDYNGIFMPALLGLIWLWPSKVLFTVIEVLLLVGVTKAFLLVPAFATLNTEGPRKTVLVFTLGFFLKYAAGWAVGDRLPGFAVTDLFGFGYLLSALLAVKMLQKRTIARVLFPTLHTSLVGFGVGSLIGFLLYLIEPVAVRDGGPRTPRTSLLCRGSLGCMTLARVRARATDGERYSRASMLGPYAELWEGVNGWLARPAGPPPAWLSERAAQLGLGFQRLSPSREDARDAYVLMETEERLDRQHGWDTAVLFPGEPGPALEVPHPKAEAPGAEAAALLCPRLRCRAIIAAGIDPDAQGVKGGRRPGLPLRVASEGPGAGALLRLRVDPRAPEGRPTLEAGAPLSGEVREALGREGVVVVSTAPAGRLPLPWFQDRAAVLRFHPADLWRLLAEGAPRPDAASPGTDVATLLLAPQLSDRREPPPPLRPAPSETELRFLEDVVALPLLSDATGVPPRSRGALVARMAALVDYRLMALPCGADQTECLLLWDGHAPGSGWGSVVARPGGAPLSFEVPFPDRERGTLPIGLELWEAGRAGALVLGGAATWRGMSPGWVGPSWPPSLAFHQAVHRAFRASGPDAAVLVLRGFASRKGLREDAVLSVLAPGGASLPISRLFTPGGPWERLGAPVRLYDVSQELVGLEGGGPQVAFSAVAGEVPVATVWLSERMRERYVPARSLLEALEASGLPLEHGDAPISSRLLRDLKPAGDAAPREGLGQGVEVAERFQRTHNVRELGRLRRWAEGAPGRRALAVLDPRHGLPYLLLEATSGRSAERGVFFLGASPASSRVGVTAAEGSATEAGVADAIARRANILVRGELSPRGGAR